MKDISIHLRSDFAGLELSEVLRRPTGILLSVSDDAASALESVGIATVFDLGSSWLFALAATAAGAGQITTTSERLGLVSTDWLKPNVVFGSLSEIGSLPLESLQGITDQQAADLKQALNVITIRDFAFWPPRQVAHTLVNEAAGTLLDFEEQQSEELRPRLGEYPTERVYYDTLLMLGTEQDPELKPLDGPLSLQKLADEAIGFGQPAVGALATYSQSWFAQAITLGHMLHSLALAPGEATRIAVIDWSRRSSATATEAIAETERLDSSLDHSRAISEVQNSVADEMQRGGSMSDGWAKSTSKAKGVAGSIGGGIAGAIGYAVGAAGIGIGGSYAKQESETEFRASSASWSIGSRSVMADMTQKVNDRTEQHSNSVRNRRATAVREVSQSEHEQVSTRIVANYNHMHALTVQYFEVVQIYRVAVQLHEFTRVLYLPFDLLDFSTDNAYNLVTRFRGQLISAALTQRARELLIDVQGSVEVRGAIRVQVPFGYGVAAADYLTDTVAFRAAPAPDAPPTPASPSTPTNAPIHDGATEVQPSPPSPPATPHFTRVRPGPLADVLPGNAKLVAIGFDEVGVARVRIDQTGAAATSNTHDVPESTNQVDLADEILLRTVESIHVARDESADTTGLMVLRYESDGRQATAAVPINLADKKGMQKVAYISADAADRRAELLAHLQGNRAYYTQVIIQTMDSASLAMLLSGLSWQGKPLIEQVEPSVVAIAGNFLVLRAPAESNDLAGTGGKDMTWGELLEEELGINFNKQDTRLVPIPTGGVFAEAVLGRSNSAEKLDITRFWNWQDSPIPLQPTEIAPVTTGSRALAEDLTPGQLGAPVLNVMNPTQLPDPAGLNAILGAIASGNMFRDMSGLAGTQAAGQAASAGTLSAATEAGRIASENYRIATEQATEMAKTAADMWKMQKSSEGGSGSKSTGGISGDGARINHGKDMDQRGVSGSGEGMKVIGSDQAGTSGQTPQTLSDYMDTVGSRELAYSDESAAISPALYRAAAGLGTVNPVPASSEMPGYLTTLCSLIEQIKSSWEDVRQAIVTVAENEFSTTWTNGARTENEIAMHPTIESYWQEPAFHGQALPGWVNIPDSAWSAVFIAWVVDQAGGGNRFSKVDDEANYRSLPGNPVGFRPVAHWRYLAPAVINENTSSVNNPFYGYEIGILRPQAGDIIVRDRGGSGATFTNFEGRETHGDIIVEVDTDAGVFHVIGGNAGGPGCLPNQGCTVNRRQGGTLTADGFIDPASAPGANQWFALIRINTDIFTDPRCDRGDGINLEDLADFPPGTEIA